MLLLCPGLVRAQSWQSLPTTTVDGTSFFAGQMLLLTDGTVVCQNVENSDWYKLTPDAFGSYANGTWTAISPMPTNYGPLYYASAVLADGRMVVLGGEYNVDGASDTNMAAIYDPVADSWSRLAAPPGFANIGDASCAVLPDGRFLMANQFGINGAILDPTNLTWTLRNFNGKADPNSEEGWAMLQDGSLLTVDCENNTHAEKYDPLTDTWTSAGETTALLPGGTPDIVPEMGPMVTRPDGTVVAFGASGHNSLYHPDTNSWSAVPDFPNGEDIADGPAVLLPNGNVFCGASPGIFNVGLEFYEYDGTNLNLAPTLPDAPNISSYFTNMIMLPSGQVLFSSFSGEVDIYTPAGGPQDAWRPTITNCPAVVSPGNSYTITGTQFNGLSQCSAYGDDSSNATNYPLVRITNLASGHVFYFRTHDHSTMAIATGTAPVSTTFDVPITIEQGPAMLEVVANGIPSQPFVMSVGDPGAVLTDVSASPYTLNGGLNSTGTVRLNQPAPAGGFVVSLRSARPTIVGVPATVTIPEGNVTATFPITTIAVATDTTVRITATLSGIAKTVDVTVLAPTVLTLSLNPPSVVGGKSSTATVTLTGPAPTSGVSVALSNNNAALVSMPTGATVAPGGTTATFTITTKAVNVSTPVNITAKYGTTVTSTLTITPPALSSLSIAPSSVKGGQTATGTVTLSDVAPAGGVVVNITSSNASLASGSANVTVPAGSTSATFTITTHTVATSTNITFTARLGTASNTAVLNLTPPDLTSLTLSPATVTGGTASTGTVTISDVAPTGGLTVTLSSDKSAATVPANVVVAAGSKTATFTVSTTTVTANTVATITAKFNNQTQTAALTIQPGQTQTRLPFDFNNDGHNDIVFQNSDVSQVVLWYTNGLNITGGVAVNALPAPGWFVVGCADINKDGNPDLFLQNQTSGQITVWYLNGNKYIGGEALSQQPSAGYKVVGIGDFNGDGKPDILYQNATSGQLAVWFLDGAKVTGGVSLPYTPAAGYNVVGVGDFNADGKPDIVFQNTTTNQVVVWYMNGTTYTGNGGATSSAPLAGWVVKAVEDINNDGKPDIIFQNTTSNQVSVWYMNGLTVTSGGAVSTVPTQGYTIRGPH